MAPSKKPLAQFNEGAKPKTRKPRGPNKTKVAALPPEIQSELAALDEKREEILAKAKSRKTIEEIEAIIKKLNEIKAKVVEHKISGFEIKAKIGTKKKDIFTI